MQVNQELPERATMSLKDNPCAAKLDTRPLRLDVGGGIEVFASALLAVSESFLPNPTFQEGPPNCTCQEKHQIKPC